MRRIMMFDNVSADGYYASSDGGLDWVVQDDEQHADAAGALPQTDTVLFGRKTYQQFASFWPHATHATGPHGGASSPAMSAIARFLNEATKLVFSTTLTEASWKGSRILRTIDPRELAAMKQQAGGDMIIFGSGSVVSTLTEHGLIDEYQLVVNPVLLGGGRSWLTDVSMRRRLELVEAHPFKSGNVRLRYKLAG